MKLDENSGEPISLEEARIYVKDFKEKFPEEVKASYMGRVNFMKLLEQKDCIGIRIYNGYDVKEERLNVVLVGVDFEGNDMTNGLIMDRTVPCPSYCDNKSALI
ncbi:hypothetical protein EZL74_11150 [Flavobacterium silvisoli]|uniref:Uncharacterized protein n=1 Tax=Flavobacterium silvisoli TaxID=2529433 RepID=A0A4Q9YRI0_9FLAO|nr:hypothetical protein [Flavobacterium silvisoli]TBX66137.1 hypothetical protein EZL74_11150 [Flavobacterium silvisoli]